jgi:RNA polymerase sigma-70 factor, ECF subfamily
MSSNPQWDWAALRRLSIREARRILAAPDQVDEAVQEALARMWRQRETCRNQARPEAWASQIARREAMRQHKRARRRSDREVALGGHHDIAAPAPGAEQRLAALDVQRALRPLADDDRKLLALRYVEDMTQPAAAEALGIAEGTAKVRLHRLRKKLREVLDA